MAHNIVVDSPLIRFRLRVGRDMCDEVRNDVTRPVHLYVIPLAALHAPTPQPHTHNYTRFPPPNSAHRPVALADAVVAHDVQDAHADVVAVAAAARQPGEREARVQPAPGVGGGARLRLGERGGRRRGRG